MASSPKKKSRASNHALSGDGTMRSRMLTFKSLIIASVAFCLCFTAFLIKDETEYLCRYFGGDSGDSFANDTHPCHYVKLGVETEEKRISTTTTTTTHHRKINAISILGERNSGTTWMYDHLTECFNHSIPVHRRLSRYKHWFQNEQVGHIVNDTLVIAMFRNPFEWIEGMRKKPHHAPAHMFLGWEEFVSKPWTMERVGSDLTLNETMKSRPHGCQEEFSYHSIISCHTRPYPVGYFNKTHYSEHQPFYELKHDGDIGGDGVNGSGSGSGSVDGEHERDREPYANILELRAAKNYNFLSTISYQNVKELWVLQYEKAVNRGTKELLQRIEEMTGAKATCVASPPQVRRHRHIRNSLMEYLLEHVNWEAEELVGYSRTGLLKSSTNSTIYKIWS